MDATLKARWVATLRSGNFKQSKQMLRDDKNRCCCLGVLCDLVKPNGWARRDSFGTGTWHHGMGDLYPSWSLMQKIGLDEDTGRRLAGMNDNGQSFDEIADFIERNV